MDEDPSLLQRWRAGDAAAGELLFARHFPGLYRFFAGKVTRDIDDLIQKTMLACVEGRDRFRGDGQASYRSYLYGIARHMLYGHYRRHAHDRFDVLETSLEDLAPSPSQVVDGAAAERVLAAGLRRIPVDAQVLLELHYWEGMTHQELADAMEVTLGVVKGRLARAKQQLRTQVNQLQALGPVVQSEDALELDRWVASLPRPVLVPVPGRDS